MFLGSVESKVDKKGRASVPASFRAALSLHSFNGIIGFPSLHFNAIEGCDFEYMERLKHSVGSLDLFSDEQDDLASILFASAHRMVFEGESGRVTLPIELRDHAGITDRALFVGRGESFQIWSPERHAVKISGALERARRDGRTVRVRPANEPGDAS